MVKDSELKKDSDWGLLTALDLHDCDPNIVEDKEKIREYFIQVCDNVMQVERYGDPVIHRFGNKEIGMEGYTAVQLIVTSSITSHFGVGLDGKGYAYIDVFSCASYDPDKVAEFTKNYFSAKSYNKTVIHRK